MKSIHSYSIIGFILLSSIALNSDEQDLDSPASSEVEQVLQIQSNAWNDGNIEGFMQTYWNSEDLTFSSGGKTTRGWQATLDGYKKRYPAGNMGHLTFDNLETTILSQDSALVLGQWHLKYDDRNLDGNFSLVLKKMNGHWKIIHDHSSSLEQASDKQEKIEN